MLKQINETANESALTVFDSGIQNFIGSGTETILYTSEVFNNTVEVQIFVRVSDNAAISPEDLKMFAITLTGDTNTHFTYENVSHSTSITTTTSFNKSTIYKLIVHSNAYGKTNNYPVLVPGESFTFKAMSTLSSGFTISYRVLVKKIEFEV